MPRCRCYEMPDGTVRVVHPAPQSRFPDEPEADWYARVMARTEAATPELAGRPFHDLDAADLPDRTTRHAWRVRGGRVVVDPSVTKPETPAARRRARLAKATTLEELKGILMDEGGGG